MASEAGADAADAVAGSGPAADALRKAEIVRLLMATGDTARSIIAATLRDSGGTPSSAADMLWALATSKTPMTLREIAAKLGRDPSTATLAADKLEAAGIVARHPHPTDGRKRILVLTGRGIELWHALRDELHASNMLADLNTDQQRDLLGLLRRIR
jgi:DNA-binding MarR family transcriptional regulator